MDPGRYRSEYRDGPATAPIRADELPPVGIAFDDLEGVVICWHSDPLSTDDVVVDPRTTRITGGFAYAAANGNRLTGRELTRGCRLRLRAQREATTAGLVLTV